MTSKIIEIHKPLSKTVKELFDRPKKRKPAPKAAFQDYAALSFVGPAYFGYKTFLNSLRSIVYLSGSLFGAATTFLSCFLSKEAKEFTRFSFHKGFECTRDAILDIVAIPMTLSIAFLGMFFHLNQEN